MDQYNNNQENSQNNLDDSQDSDGGDENHDSTRQVGKRRSKNDNQGRDFKCKYCEKTYLSYPALYTHMKQKHSKGPDGEVRNPPTSGRGRGRPRKNPYQRLDPRTEDFFKAPERDGGPVDPLCCFEEVYMTIFTNHLQDDGSGQNQKNQEEREKIRQGMYDYPIFKNLIQFSKLIDENGRLIKQSEAQPTISRPLNNQGGPMGASNGNGFPAMGNGLQQSNGQASQMMYQGQPAGGQLPPKQENGGQYMNQQQPNGAGQLLQQQQMGLNGETGNTKQLGQQEAPSAADPAAGSAAFNQNANEAIPSAAGADQQPKSEQFEGGESENEGQDKEQENGAGLYQNQAANGHGAGYQPAGGDGVAPSQSNEGGAHGGVAHESHIPTDTQAKWQRNYDLLTDDDRQVMLVDEIFALYLYRMSNRINRSYYKTVLAYVIFFRECLNEYGWGKKIESEAIQLENNPDLKNDIANKQFCLVNNAEHAPEICNEFVTVYMEYKKSIIDIPKHDQIDLTINFCHWLFQCQFTCSKLTMIG